MLNRITMTGRLVADPELRRTQSGVSVTSFRIANDRDYGKGEEKETDFFDVVAWRSTAEFICKYFTKGRMISVDGRLQTRGWKDGKATTASALRFLWTTPTLPTARRMMPPATSPPTTSLRATAPIRALCRAAAMTLRRISNSGKTTRGEASSSPALYFFPAKANIPRYRRR